MMEYLWVSPKMRSTSRGTIPRSYSMDTLYILFIECVVWSLDFYFVMNVGFVLGKPPYMVLCLNEQMNAYSGFVDGANH